jgi:hypothetical protein
MKIISSSSNCCDVNVVRLRRFLREDDVVEDEDDKDEFPRFDVIVGFMLMDEADFEDEVDGELLLLQFMLLLQSDGGGAVAAKELPLKPWLLKTLKAFVWKCGTFISF